MLEARGIERYLPLVEREREWADRRNRVAFPLFPGYLFVRFRARELGRVLATPRLVSVVRMDGRPAPVREEQLEAVRRLVEGANATGREPRPADWLAPGDPVEVTRGPFRGMRGLLLEVRGGGGGEVGGRVAVRLDALRQATSVELERDVLRPLERA